MKNNNPLDQYEQAYFAGKQAAIAEIDATDNLLKKLSGEALSALEIYNTYNIKTDSYRHSTNLIYELRSVLEHKRIRLREWRSLTDNEIEDIANSNISLLKTCREIESTLKERNAPSN